MGVNTMDSHIKLQGIQSGYFNDGSSIDRKIEQLKEKLEQVKKNKQLSPQEKEKRTKNIQKQIENLEKQKAQLEKEEKAEDSSKVDSQKVQDVKKMAVETQPKEEALDAKRQFDTFEHQPESQAIGVYAFFCDEEGKLVIKFDAPSNSTEEKVPNEIFEDGKKISNRKIRR